MLFYVLRRVAILVPLLFFISILIFIVIQLPPGDFLDIYIYKLKQSGIELGDDVRKGLERQYGLDRPYYYQYYRWISNIILKGDFGYSFGWNQPVNNILKDRVLVTLIISISSIFLVWLISIPIAVISATRQYSFFDYLFTFVGFIGLAVPNFLLALVLAWFVYEQTGLAITGLFSKEYMNQPWSYDKFIDLLKHIWLPVVIVGVAGTAGMIRVLRATLLDELRKQYVITARSKGVSEFKLLFKYPIRIAMNPVFSTIGWLLPATFSGEVIVGIVLNLQTIGPVLMRATLTQDMYLIGSIVLILSFLTVLGTLISDILLAWLDPRIRYI
jgi:peptide/nickel transport system permease protein